MSSKLIPLALLCVLLLMAASTYYVKHKAKVNEVGSAAATTLRDSNATPYSDLDGNPFTFADYRNKVRVVNVWASWSPFTATEFPILNRVASDYKATGLVVLAINRKEPIDRIKAYLNQLGTEEDNLIQVVDLTDAYYASVGGFAMPETIIYDETGAVAYHKRGVIAEGELRAALDKLINK